MPEPRFVAACVQMRSGREPLANRDAAVAGVREAAAAGAQYVQTPEMTSLVERSRTAMFEKVSTQDDDPTLAALRAVARETGAVVQIGSLPIRNGEKIANRAFLIDGQGEIVAAYDKLHLYDVDLPNGERWRESATYTGGACAVVAETALAPIGLGICYDIRFPALFRALAEAGASILTAPACFTQQTGEAHWHVLHRARAIETGSFMISAAQGGRHEDGRDTYGHSIIVDPWGRVIAEAEGAEPGVILAEIDLARVAEARGRIPALQHARSFTVERVGRCS
ncbi:carbon-nitrogen hydrolase family protein [Methylobacterium oxalidis]|uniref:Amidohydrolase n=1 Tax=Methylobacterium oxalidis TaxID=944322 RepID=A0A512IY13_9HYPH|nr:carbon-nitrogen hydrolase family protein [Methylobacterium oxalidis]GEP02585.1 amidohydrolase [Methylobacterium oxalidis]GJE32544.1 Deaminated glutathione amidase [Methylobacterium oxalidis]GLS61794.1 amidohydrolase [Methylobacterium oxalidis]